MAAIAAAALLRIRAEIELTPEMSTTEYIMVTSTALVESEVASRSGMKVVLPKANAAGPVSQRRSDPVLTVTKTGDLYLGAHKVDVANLEGENRAQDTIRKYRLMFRELQGFADRHRVATVAELNFERLVAFRKTWTQQGAQFV